jgi:hypothetical protein
MIIIFAYEGYGISHVYFMSKYWDKNCMILGKYNEEYFKKATVIIPVGILSQKKLADHLPYKQKFLTSSDFVYDKLDDKINFYKMVETSNILKNSDIKLIPTYDDNYRGPNKYGNFIIKHRKGAGSSDNTMHTDYLHNLIKKYSANHQIQDVLNVKKIHGINYLCKKGVLINGLDFIFSGFIDKSNNNSDVNQTVTFVEQKYVDVISKIVEQINYSGFVEFEFLEDVNNNIYLLESNPRISGNIKCIISENGLISYPYINELIIPYCDLVQKSNMYSSIMEYDNINSIYHGNLSVPKHKICGCGVLKFLEQVLIPHDDYYFDRVMDFNDGNFTPNKLVNVNDVISTCNKKKIKIIFSYACEHNDFLLNNYDILKVNNINFLF